jgi:hypothetical protein
MALLDAPMALSTVCVVACGRRRGERKNQLNIGLQLWLVLLDDPDIVSALVHDRLRHVVLGQERAHRGNAIIQDQAL